MEGGFTKRRSKIFLEKEEKYKILIKLNLKKNLLKRKKIIFINYCGINNNKGGGGRGHVVVGKSKGR